MLTEKLSVVVAPEKDTMVHQLLDNLLAELAFLLILAVEDRRQLSKMGRRDVDFVHRGFKHAVGTPLYLPQYVSLEEFKKDVDLSTWLRGIEKQLELISAKVRDTALVAESEAYRTARLYYHSVKAAAKAGDKEAEQITGDLAKHFKKQGSSKEEEPCPPETKL
ncbi:MAG TPA: hypothetical protein VK186_20580 [Candidatus Deferrimicrobium sp.]|nr:hypothetical protein [Candidatus Kapabacteria bacterium]HLP61251.1 hypothetical protein [Candidatus Deferrimicrobium sp.]